MQLFFHLREDRNKAAARIFLCAAALLLLFCLPQHRCLTLSNLDSGEVYAQYPIEEGATFSVGFIHSVNKSPLIDCYLVQGTDIYVDHTIYYGFGAGVQTELNAGETLTYTDDGAMVIGNIHKKIPQLIYCVGVVSDHTFSLNNGAEISLRDLCGRSSMVEFTVKETLLPPIVLV